MASTPKADAFLNQHVICTLTDGRKVQGRLQCLDWLRNMILSDVVETRNENGRQLNRNLSQCMISGDSLVRVQICKQKYDEICSSAENESV